MSSSGMNKSGAFSALMIAVAGAAFSAYLLIAGKLGGAGIAALAARIPGGAMALLIQRGAILGRLAERPRRRISIGLTPGVALILLPFSIQGAATYFHGIRDRVLLGGIIAPPRPQGKSMPYYRGLYFDQETWDGSNIFCPEDGSSRIFVDERTKKALEEVKVRNICFESLMEFEMLIPPSDRELLRSG